MGRLYIVFFKKVLYMRMIILAVVALLLVGGAGAGAYFFFFKSAEAAPTEGEEVAHEENKKDEHAEDDGHGGGGEFVELSPLILPIVDQNGVSQVITLVVALEVPNAEAAATVDVMQPKIADAMIMDMYGILNEHAAMKGGVLQISIIKERLNKVSNDVLGEENVNDVLLQVVQQRPI